MAFCEQCGKEYKYSHQCEYTCKCGKSFTSRQSYVAHCGHCKESLGDRYKPRGFCSDDKRHKLTSEECSKGSKSKKIPIEGILSNKVPYQSNKLKYRLVEEGYKEWKCESCGLTEWLGNPIPLELHHKDGDSSNHALENDELLCPNCHSLTPNYRWKKKFIRDSQA